MANLFQCRNNGQSIDEGPNITPLIDVVFILLIFFVVSTTFIKDMNLSIDRPQAASSTPVSGKEIRVYIEKGGEIFVNGQATRLWTLQGHVRDILRSSTSKVVLVVTDKEVKVERLVEVVDQCRLAGAKNVAVATKSEVG